MTDKMDEKRTIQITKESDHRSFYDGNVTRSFEVEEYHHTSCYSHSYDGDDEETSENITITRQPRPRRISDVIDSFECNSPRESTHFTFPDFNETTSDYSSSLNTLSSKFQSPPVTPGSDVGYYSSLSTPPSTLNYRLKWSRINSPSTNDPTFHNLTTNDQMDNLKWDDTDAKPSSAEEITIESTHRVQTNLNKHACMPVSRDSSEYNMNHLKRGYAIIFNNENFCWSQQRKGSVLDVQKLDTTLKRLGFEVLVYEDLDYESISKVINDLKQRDYTNCDCLLIAVLTHGRVNNYLHARDHLYRVEMLWMPFTSDNCPSLAGKPKIFLIQACKGEQLDGGTHLVSRTETDSSSSESYKIPTMADFLIAYSTVEGFFSWRNPENGTWFIQSLCNVLEENHQALDLQRMLTIVCRKVALDFESFNDMIVEQNGQKQVPSVFSTLIRDIYFRSK